MLRDSKILSKLNLRNIKLKSRIRHELFFCLQKQGKTFIIMESHKSKEK